MNNIINFKIPKNQKKNSKFLVVEIHDLTKI